MKYIALTQIGLSVKLPSGQSKRISFSPLSAGGSVYYTTDKDEIYALEHHYRYGSLFRRDPLSTDPVSEPDIPPPTVSSDGTQTIPALQPSGSGGEGKTKVTVNVTDLDDAKEYLSRNYGYSRTKLKFKSDVLRAAERQRIVFTGL